MDKLKEEYEEKFCLTASNTELLKTNMPMYMWIDIDPPLKVWQWIEEKLKVEYERGVNDTKAEYYINSQMRKEGAIK